MAEFLKLKKSNCKNCYKCIRYCPVKSIRFSAGQAIIVGNECILCGQCFVVCPQNAKEITDDIEKVKVLITEGNPVIASIAPSFIANYNGVGIASLEKALKELGFFAAEETALGATVVKKEYERILREEKPEVLISSCCHSVNLLIQKHHQKALPYLSQVISPMQAHCMDIKKRYPNAKTVFIGPCIAKKDEANHYAGAVDAVLTFEELSGLFKKNGIQLTPEKDSTKESRARLFPIAGGILKTMDKEDSDYTYLAIDGVENCITALKEIESGKLSNCFIEMSACTGSCIGGPVMEKFHNQPIHNYKEVVTYAGSHDFEVNYIINNYKYIEAIGRKASMPSEAEIQDILGKMGKSSPTSELNCGSCGYNSCREKAIAVIQGKAELSMCLPYMMDKAECFSDTVIRNSPNAIVVLNDDLEVQKINTAACKIMNIRRESDVLGEPVIRILDPDDFSKVRACHEKTYSDRIYLAEYKSYVDRTIVYNRDYHMFICIMHDVTTEIRNTEKKMETRRQAADIADKVVEKQLKIVQEIAYLLGETAADTQTALTRLKETISDD
ncbi:[Fe-Fe] hydrogenase large subunit C-terminal domain-containing protein [Tissierella sp.]|uniref:[Fe-Fe] hydrogenase large subunit C-terminal domain-containing protein n=1 Tax=Tissierella sp. TaxID=41274 RepID=UPI0028578A9E|nr:[Fe-Fe] hydrogenase large subunit C-terminal domain-containing protein [Tissierella sp.]MDR7857404.1 [Fe-Fe] hydrogenase large subunit C-terminal domain-containing protein [Tissierella sp.]